MSAINNNFVGCTVLVYDEENKLICSDVVKQHDRTTQYIGINKRLPPEFSEGAGCRLLILSSPSPCEYLGRVVKSGSSFMFAIYKGREKEGRKAERYPITAEITILAYICDGITYDLCTPVTAQLINISRSGIRLRAPAYFLLNGDRFQFRMKIGGDDMLLTAEVTNHLDTEAEESEYGCRLISSEKVV